MIAEEIFPEGINGLFQNNFSRPVDVEYVPWYERSCSGHQNFL